jgi:hypothetical protein
MDEYRLFGTSSSPWSSTTPKKCLSARQAAEMSQVPDFFAKKSGALFYGTVSICPFQLVESTMEPGSASYFSCEHVLA